MIFLKLGGSLLTEKSLPKTPRLNVIARVAKEIAQALEAQPEINMIIGHGSGSFGHPVAEQYATHLGATSAKDWKGFVEVWWTARLLNHLVMDALLSEGLPCISFPPSTMAMADNGKIIEFITEPLELTLESGLIPVVYGDVSFDRSRGSSILSTEKIFDHLAILFKPERLLLAGKDPGVYTNFPQTEETFPILDDDMLSNIRILGSEAPDVTGGMLSKVEQAMSLARAFPSLEVRIFSAEEPGTLRGALLGETPGTLLSPSS
jgi:isopentenyl phosphate kinase